MGLDEHLFGIAELVYRARANDERPLQTRWFNKDGQSTLNVGSQGKYKLRRGNIVLANPAT